MPHRIMYDARILIVRILRMNKGKMLLDDLNEKLKERINLPNHLSTHTIVNAMKKDEVVTFNDKTRIVRLKYQLKPVKHCDSCPPDDDWKNE